MKLLRTLLDRAEAHFQEGKPLHRIHALHEAVDAFAFTPGKVTTGATHVRDAMDLKRLMMTVVFALTPAVLMAMYNTGLQANLAIERLVAAGASPSAAALDGWRTALYLALGLGFDSGNVLAAFVHGALYYLPVLIVTFAAGGAWEVIFASARRHEVNEGFIVTAMLFPLILPPTIPLWQVALGITFGVVVAKEVFGGVGMNIFNPALAGRAFLFFAYPGEISGEQVWIAARGLSPDGVSGATPLAVAVDEGLRAVAERGFGWLDSFLGFVPGSMGETSALACLIGAAILVVTRVGSYRTMAGVFLGTALTAALFNGVGSASNPAFAMPFWWHMVLGGWAFGAVFMATDPVSAAFTRRGQWIYGFLIGALVVAIRVVNPAYPEGMMLAILFANIFAPLIDWCQVRAYIKRRSKRDAEEPALHRGVRYRRLRGVLGAGVAVGGDAAGEAGDEPQA
ncbi:MAG: NADH:ubiquinone reductase (Na(+)-transporting) subunit B [Candidatus Eisenbacteria bacterium]|uniref:Na(+)-translocating NADH-quinone reductase subunit B n=1 Tax=Eiseniibacteriota bacterium TaxID=2212470 RepID=A0A938BQF7_UNCEI|nr:NADH:ubiquinone reductase (Na(+)-transporting) subunit B [Candidatus Eisenbacteria bacterium]